MKREDAILLLKEHVKNEGLFIHCIATAAIMRAAAARLGEDEDRWEIIGILHDIDFEEIGGDMSLHGDAGYEILTSHGIDEDIAGPVKRHNYEKYGDFDTPVDLALTAADNISGLITACALVKGGDVSAVTGKTIKKNTEPRSVTKIFRSLTAINQMCLSVFMGPYFLPLTALKSQRLSTMPTTATPVSTTRL